MRSAIDALRRRQEGGTLDPDRPDPHTLTELKDLAGVRVLAFPPSRYQCQADRRIRRWTPDPVRINGDSEVVAFKYYGFCREASRNVTAEIHDDPEMKIRNRDVYRALRAFEHTFEEVVKRATARA